jgi:dephospho-CoA kinase
MRSTTAMLLGVTGGIGSGKSTAANILVEHGAALIDADAISREATAVGGSAIGRIALEFGVNFIMQDGSLDRDRMRTLVFADKNARVRLEAVVHPIVGIEIERQSRHASAAGARCVVIEIPLLVESGRWRGHLHRILTVDCSVQTQVRRVARRIGMDESQAMRIIDVQASREARLAASDFVVQNDIDSTPVLARQIERVAQILGL